MNCINFLNLLVAEKSVPLAKINHILDILQNHSYFIINIWLISIFAFMVIYLFYGLYIDCLHHTNHQIAISEKHATIAFGVAVIYIMVSCFLVPAIAYSDYSVTVFPFRIKPSIGYVGTTIKHNVKKIPYERHELELYHHNKTNPIAREKLPHVEHLLNKHIKYDNSHIKDIHAPMINHKLYIVSPHSKLYQFAHASYNPDHPNQTKSNAK